MVGATTASAATPTVLTASASNVKLVNGAQAANVFWIVGSSATLGTYSILSGNILASVSPVTYELIGY
ncbi:ice-binding family protein [Frankia sp. ACN1ag]|uniref:ice-binding family protein n=1 Tax=Frankia sp. ACN1ag TaxID=102891 RepID=UPI0009FB2D38|nr:ice-binding family protein [Frankia sp. ACN1ag]